MNKAEEQYLYNKGKIDAQSIVMDTALCVNDEYPDSATDFISDLREYISKYRDAITNKGMIWYYNSIIRLIENNVITDWPSFVEHMTGETYEICQCYKCSRARGELPSTRMILCSKCGNKRCPHATNHELECTNSNEPGQEGSVYE